MGTRLALEIAPEFLAALLGVAQVDIDRAFALVEVYRSTAMVPNQGYSSYKEMMDDPVASILSDYTRPFEYEGATFGGTLGFGKWGFTRALNILRYNGIEVDPVAGSFKRTFYPSEIDTVITALLFDDARELNGVVLADHCTGILWA